MEGCGVCLVLLRVNVIVFYVVVAGGGGVGVGEGGVALPLLPQSRRKGRGHGGWASVRDVLPSTQNMLQHVYVLILYEYIVLQHG